MALKLENENSKPKSKTKRQKDTKRNGKKKEGGGGGREGERGRGLCVRCGESRRSVDDKMRWCASAKGRVVSERERVGMHNGSSGWIDQKGERLSRVGCVL